MVNITKHLKQKNENGFQMNYTSSFIAPSLPLISLKNGILAKA